MINDGIKGVFTGEPIYMVRGNTLISLFSQNCEYKGEEVIKTLRQVLNGEYVAAEPINQWQKLCKR